jgi:hypothetical protein
MPLVEAVSASCPWRRVSAASAWSWIGCPVRTLGRAVRRTIRWIWCGRRSVPASLTAAVSIFAAARSSPALASTSAAVILPSTVASQDAAVTGAPAGGNRAGGTWQAAQAAGIPEGEPGDPHRRHSSLILGSSLVHGRPAVQPGEPCGDRALIAVRHDQVRDFAEGKQARLLEHHAAHPRRPIARHGCRTRIPVFVPSTAHQGVASSVMTTESDH